MDKSNILLHTVGSVVLSFQVEINEQIRIDENLKHNE